MNLYTNNIMPIMSSNNQDSILLTASSIHDARFPTYSLFDDKNGSAWATKMNEPYGWIKISFKNNKKNISKYTIQARKHEYYFDGEVPNEWKLYGSNTGTFDDNGGIIKQDYFLLDERKNEINWHQGEKRKYEFNNPKEYSFYKFDFKGLSGEKWICIDNIELMSIKSFYIIQQKNKYHTINNNQIIQVNTSEITSDFFKRYGFNDCSLVTKKLLKTTFEDLNNVKLLMWIDEKNIQPTIEFELEKPFRPIDKFKGKIEIIKQVEK